MQRLHQTVGGDDAGGDDGQESRQYRALHTSISKVADRKASGKRYSKALEDEHLLMYGVAESHLQESEVPPGHAQFSWEGCNRGAGDRRGGGVGVLFRQDLGWSRVRPECREHVWLAGDLMGQRTAVGVVYMWCSWEMARPVQGNCCTVLAASAALVQAASCAQAAMAADELCVSVNGVLTRLAPILDEDGARVRQGNGYAYSTEGMFMHNFMLRATGVCIKCLFWKFEPARNLIVALCRTPIEPF